jgi:signal transduction histidine kinase
VRAQARRQDDTPHDLAMLAHELRRRMAALRVAGEAVGLLHGQGQDASAMMELLLGEIDELDDLAREVLRDDGRDRPADDGGVADVVAAVQVAARTVATARGVSIRVDADSDAQVQVRTSATMLRQAIENLLDNAAAHGGPDGVEIGIHPDPAAGQVDVVVADRGAAEASGAASGSGHGIGLFLVRRFLDDADGRSWMSKRNGGGTVVGLRLPLRPAGPDQLDTAVNT